MFSPRRPAKRPTSRQVDFALAVGGAPVSAPTPAPPTPVRKNATARTAWRRGRDAERECRRRLIVEGYLPQADALSMGVADVVAIKRGDGPGPTARLVQVKRVAKYAPTGLNDAVRRWLGLGRWAQRGGAHHYATDARREAWLWVDGDGWAARLSLTPDDALAPIDGAHVQEVMQAIEKSVYQAHQMSSKAQRANAEAEFRAKLRAP